ncbi:hypothetical protein JW968_05745 [Candidatus Woesearchaeota archaeon]|nr:hypothetical protein [Candidatus Woesearchaeota archaeon]
MQTDGVFHIRINEPILVRRTLLEASKSLVEALHSYERFKALRIQKIEAVVELRHVMREIAKLMKGLERELPKTNLRASHPKSYSASSAAKPAVKLKTEPRSAPDPYIASEIDRLEKELNYIESKLDNLTKP